MAKMTIYVPDDLKQRIDATEGVSWSPVACQAFEQKLAEIINQRGVKKMDDVIMRLKASKAKSDSAIMAEGRAAGEEWAKNTAEAFELERLDTLVGNDWHAFLYPPLDMAHSPAETVAFLLRPEIHGDRFEASSFWDKAAGVCHPSPEFIDSFAEGALSVWDQVKDKL